ncbi:MAG: hypothetical protein RLZZ532_4333 [Cyanobacteriota bacterium]|jgi:hypothetical protein
MNPVNPTGRVRKSITLSNEIDMQIRIESTRRRIAASQIIEEALIQLLKINQ